MDDKPSNGSFPGGKTGEETVETKEDGKAEDEKPEDVIGEDVKTEDVKAEAKSPKTQSRKTTSARCSRRASRTPRRVRSSTGW
jgi:hypothetical protein